MHLPLSNKRRIITLLQPIFFIAAAQMINLGNISQLFPEKIVKISNLTHSSRVQLIVLCCPYPKKGPLGHVSILLLHYYTFITFYDKSKKNFQLKKDSVWRFLPQKEQKAQIGAQFFFHATCLRFFSHKFFFKESLPARQNCFFGAKIFASHLGHPRFSKDFHSIEKPLM